MRYQKEGVPAAIADSFEQIHRSNLVMMGIIPLLTVEATSPDGKKKSFQVLARVDDPTDLEDVRQGGVLHQVLRERTAAN